MIRGPIAQVILRFAVVPLDKVEFIAPTKGGDGEDGDIFDDFVFDLGHNQTSSANVVTNIYRLCSIKRWAFCSSNGSLGEHKIS